VGDRFETNSIYICVTVEGTKQHVRSVLLGSRRAWLANFSHIGASPAARLNAHGENAFLVTNKNTCHVLGVAVQ
jgi:hypothetical protein